MQLAWNYKIEFKLKELLEYQQEEDVSKFEGKGTSTPKKTNKAKQPLNVIIARNKIPEFSK